MAVAIAAAVALVAWAAYGWLSEDTEPPPITPGPVAEVETAVFGFG